ncbi:CPBP family intramembrane glutamic endopeptidase [Paenibacillus sp. FSL R7-0302]|uniref:CPBP family intramembrane glutamic endopeptidase n=1 Tax=Paenibacillus sp. FSL R7-0302 TaxID=2921681 RepID=UPI0030F5EFDF
MTVSMMVSSLIQLILFSFIPLVCWLIFARKKQSFWSWIGLKAPEIKKKNLFFILFFSGLLLFLSLGWVIMLFFTNGSDVAASQFDGVGVAGIAAALFYAFVQTGLSEEIVFRGFIGKRLISAVGFTAGNSVQAALFGCLHGAMFFSHAGCLNALIITLFTAVIGWFMGYINEKLAGGSIVPSWIMHGLANLFTAMMMMFNLF